MTSEKFTHEQITAAAQRVASSERFASSPVLKKIFLYIIDEELAGRGGNIKALAIAWDVLEKPRDFDPQNDPIVRVNLGRLRAVLAEYYSDEGKDDPLRISIPKGAYRPEFTSREELEISEPQTKITDPEIYAGENLTPSFRKAFIPLMLTGLVLLAGAVTLGYLLNDLLNRPEDKIITSSVEKGAQIPIVEITEFIGFGDIGNKQAVAALRQQMIVDLSRFKNIVVRTLDAAAIDMPDTELEPMRNTYRLEGNILDDDGNYHISLVLTDRKTNDVVWSDHMHLGEEGRLPFDELHRRLAKIAIELADGMGIIHRREIAKLQDRLQHEELITLSSYECVLSFHAFIRTRDESDEELASNCLAEFVETDTDDASVWAAWAYLQFLNWAKGDEDVTIDVTLAAIRKAVQLDPSDAENFRYLAVSLMTAGQLDASLEAYNHSIELNPNQAYLQAALGWHQILAGDWELGLDQIKYAMDETGTPPSWMYIPFVLHSFKQNDYEQALSDAQLIIQNGDNRGFVLALAASIELENRALIEEYTRQIADIDGFDRQEPLKEIGRLMNVPDVIEKIERIVKGANII